MRRLAIAVPALGNVPAVFANDLTRLYAATLAAVPVCTLAMVIGTFVHQARETLLHDVVELWGATHVLWLDADMTFPPDAALRLLSHDRDVVAANYMTRTAHPKPTASRDGRPVSSHGVTGLEAVDHVGMGVFLMRSSVVQNIPRPRFWYSTLTETEDVYFCRRLNEAGHPICVDHDLSNEVGHVGAVLREPCALTIGFGGAVEDFVADVREGAEPAWPPHGESAHLDVVLHRLARWKGVGPGHVVAGAAGEHRDVVVPGQALGDGAAMRLGATGDLGPEPLNDAGQLHGRRASSWRSRADSTASSCTHAKSTAFTCR